MVVDRIWMLYVVQYEQEVRLDPNLQLSGNQISWYVNKDPENICVYS